MTADGPPLILVREPDSPAAEAFRFLRTALLSAGERQMRSLLVVGAERDRSLDVSTIAGNLAVTFARSGLNTLLVDAGLRRPRLHAIFALDNSHGLTDYLAETNDPTPPAQTTSVERLRVLPTGPRPSGATDLFASPRTAQALDRLAESVDLVLYVATPVLETADTIALGRLTDACLLVVRGGATSRDSAQRAKALLEAGGARLIGVALVGA